MALSKGSPVLREKRPLTSGKWDYASLSINYSYPVGDGKPANDGDSYRMAAVYSEHFINGRGCRLFYHLRNETNKWVQELIWDQRNDNWNFGSSIDGVLLNSHLSATVDGSQILRLFYWNEHKQLQYSYTNIEDNITDPNHVYKQGTFL